MSFKKLFLPVGLVAATCVALGIPLSPGVSDTLSPLKPLLVAIIFLVNGYQVHLRHMPRDRRFAGAFLATAVLSLGIAPWLGQGISALFGMSMVMSLGLVVMSSVPSTLSSCIVLTEVSEGNPLWALVMTVGLNLVGVFTVPFMITACVDANGVTVSASRLLAKLVLWVLVPFLIGNGLRMLIGERKLPAIIRYTPSSCVILTVWLACIAQREMLLSLRPATLSLVAAGSLTVHLVLMLASLGLSYPLRLEPGERRALLFVGSQKTLPVALGVLTAMGQNAGAAVVVCIVFHLLQLVVDSTIASKLAGRAAA